MKESPFIVDVREDEDSFALKQLIPKYLRYWPWFIGAIVLCILLGYAYMRYAPTTYLSVAKIKIIDDSKELDIASDAFSLLGGGTNINLDNEIEILRSYRLLNQVVDQLHLDVSYYQVGNIRTTQIWNPPFIITKANSRDSITRSLEYRVQLNNYEVTITDEEDNVYKTIVDYPDKKVSSLPFRIRLADSLLLKDYSEIEYKVVLSPLKEAVLELNRQLQVQPTNKNSEILSLSIEGQSMDRSEAILNTVIDKFNEDGILDRQQVSKRTLDFIDERFLYLTVELDSIEGGKQDFKKDNNLSYIEADADATIQRKSIAADEVSQLQTQISLADILKKTVINQSAFSLLPVNVGLENSSLNAQVTNYNELVLNRDKLALNVGEQHPTLRAISGQLELAKSNIIKTINVFQTQLRTSMRQLNREQSRANTVFSALPEKEKRLRAIERQQSIKENLFLLLLQKREEAAINLAVTAPSVKIVDYGLTNSKPVSPKRLTVYPLSLLLGMFLPFIVLYTRFSLNTKVNDITDLEKLNPEVSVLSEIPSLKDGKIFRDAFDRSDLAESFRILSTNVNFMLKSDDNKLGHVVYVTSSLSGEGKSLVSLNLSMAYASLHKKVLLVGADLRNPQLHGHFKMDKDVIGLSNFLHYPEMTWKDCIHDGFGDKGYHKICYSGPIPPNAPQLLASGGLGKFMEQARKEFDYIVVDTAPTLQVTDTLLISKYADVTLYVVRAGKTEKKLLEFSKRLNTAKKLKNMAYVLNDVKPHTSKGYNFGYGYGSHTHFEV